MDPTQMAEFLKSFQDLAKSNAELVKEVKAGREESTAAASTTTTTTTTTPDNSMIGLSGNVALSGIKIPCDMGRDAEERLINFHEWKEEIEDRMNVAGVIDEKQQVMLAMLWGGKDIKEFAVEKAKVQLKAGTNVAADTWTDAVQKIETTMEGEINEAFAMFKFRQCGQERQSVEEWYKRLKSAVKTLGLSNCTCGHGYTEARAIRDIMVELTTDGKLRKDALAKDLKLADLLKEAEANELARKRAATVEGKNVMKLKKLNEEESPSEEEVQLMIAKLKKSW